MCDRTRGRAIVVGWSGVSCSSAVPFDGAVMHPGTEAVMWSCASLPSIRLLSCSKLSSATCSSMERLSSLLLVVEEIEFECPRMTISERALKTEV